MNNYQEQCYSNLLSFSICRSLLGREWERLQDQTETGWQKHARIGYGHSVSRMACQTLSRLWRDRQVRSRLFDETGQRTFVSYTPSGYSTQDKDMVNSVEGDEIIFEIQQMIHGLSYFSPSRIGLSAGLNLKEICWEVPRVLELEQSLDQLRPDYDICLFLQKKNSE